MEQLLAQDLIDGIRSRDNYVLNFIYLNYFPVIQKMIINNNGSKLDAEDIFQDVVVTIFEKLQNTDIELRCSFKTYLYSISRNLWLQKLETQRCKIMSFHDVEEFISVKDDLELKLKRIEREKLYHKHYLGLSENCQKILRLVFNSLPAREIARIMGYKSDLYARKRKSQCRKNLINLINNDPDYKRLTTHED